MNGNGGPAPLLVERPGPPIEARACQHKSRSRPEACAPFLSNVGPPPACHVQYPSCVPNFHFSLHAHVGCPRQLHTCPNPRHHAPTISHSGFLQHVDDGCGPLLAAHHSTPVRHPQKAPGRAAEQQDAAPAGPQWGSAPGPVPPGFKALEQGSMTHASQPLRPPPHPRFHAIV